MLTEPLTTPPTKNLQIAYGILAGILFGLQFHFGPIYSSPALALVLANLFSYAVSPRARLVLTLVNKNKLSDDVYDYEWSEGDDQLEKFSFKPGQYLEWTLGHSGVDIRGNRRFFTIASSPTEENIHLGVKFYENSSSFKKKLLSLNIGDKIIASQLSGDFTLPIDTKKKLVFIAGGIGITPFRSIIKYMIDKQESRDAVLFFSNRTPKDIVYQDIFDRAQIKTIYAVNEATGGALNPNMRVGLINADMIIKEVPDYKERIFYISGPRGMVSAFEDTLKKMGVKKSNIKVDFFPGYV
jgi:ferredoxin-NADP reductase